MIEQARELENPKKMLERAIEVLDVFTRSRVSRLEISDGGLLMDSQETALERIMRYASASLGAFLSDEIRARQVKKFAYLKETILQARDTLQSHLGLIEKYQKNGDDSQKKLAALALSTIEKYNNVVVADSFTTKKEIYRYERNQLLSDNEIRGQPITLPQSVSLQYDSHSDANSAGKLFKKFRETFVLSHGNQPGVIVGSTHKKNFQFMMDTFRVKAMRMIQTLEQEQINEIVPLIKATPIKVDLETEPDLILMEQSIGIAPGTSMLLTGAFKRKESDPKFLSMPLIDSIQLSFQITHTGFPFPSQHVGWALSGEWVDVTPLRLEQVPVFHQMNQRRKVCSQQLLYNKEMIQKSRKRSRIKQQVLEDHKEVFLHLFLDLQLAMLYPHEKEDEQMLRDFYTFLQTMSSPFHFLEQIYEKVHELFVKGPLAYLEEEWLNVEITPLRKGTPQERFHTICCFFEKYQERMLQGLEKEQLQDRFIVQQGKKLGRAFQSIALQYLSEKMGFSPPLLTDLERKLQGCAYQQLLRFLDECDSHLEVVDPELVKQNLVDGWQKDILLLGGSSLEDTSPDLVALVDELEMYFNLRYSSRYRR